MSPLTFPHASTNSVRHFLVFASHKIVHEVEGNAIMSPPTMDKFLEEIPRILRDKNGVQLQEYLKYEPPLPALYNQIVSEVKQVYPASSSQSSHLENKCKSFIPEYEEGVDDGGSRASFISFMVKYFSFLRDVDVTNLVETHDQLKALLK